MTASVSTFTSIAFANACVSRRSQRIRKQHVLSLNPGCQKINGKRSTSFLSASVNRSARLSPLSVPTASTLLSAPKTSRARKFLPRNNGNYRKDRYGMFSEIRMVKDIVDQAISANKVMMFSKTFCPFCTKAKDALKSVGASFEVMELENRSG
jgi:hypothetical protein